MVDYSKYILKVIDTHLAAFILQVLSLKSVCVFSPKACRWAQDELHRVLTDNRGQEPLDIKNATTSDCIRSYLSSLHEEGDAAAQEKYYHSNCLIDAHRILF